jgi:LacI family transcriptional regulator
MSKLDDHRRPTMADVARASGHSLSTVDRVLNGRAAVRADTAQRIHEAAETLGFYAAGVIRERLRDDRPRRTLGFLLQLPDTVFYRGLGEALIHATEQSLAVRGQARVEYLEDLSPDAVAEHLGSLGERADAIAVVAAEHRAVSAAIERLHDRGVAVFALISDLSTPARAGYAGLDNRRVGRTAAWFITRLAPVPGKVAILVGSHRFQCQELCEMSFRSFVREHAPGFEILDTLVTLESSRYAEECTYDLLQRHPDLAGFYVDGSGVEGVLRALRGSPADGPLIGVGHELTSVTREGLLSGHLYAVLSHPLSALAAQLVAQMAEALANPTSGLRQVVVPFDIHTPESV